MLITWLTGAALSFASPQPAALEPAALGGGNHGDGHGKIAWFQGSYEEALAEAKNSKKLVFLDFWTSWCGYCKKLDRDAFSNAEVVELMKGFVCLNVDAESKTGAPIAGKFPIRGYPALFFVAADGSIEDGISGWLPAEKFKNEAARILAGKDTVGGLRRAVESDASSIEKRYRLAQKLLQIGDAQGREAQMGEIKKLDPEGKSLPMRRLAYEAMIGKINEAFQRDQSLDVDAVAGFLAAEKHPELLFEGNYALMQMHGYLGEAANGKGDSAGAKRHAAASRAAMKAAWPHVAAEQAGPFGNSVAWAYYEAREELSPEDKAFALEVAEKAAKAAEAQSATDDQARERFLHTLDTYACCLFMNGKKDEALKQLERCKEIDPNADVWKDRLAEFKK